VRILLDTHVALWAISDSPRLKREARGLIEEPDNRIYVSAASLWEIAIKYALQQSGPNSMPIPAAEAERWFREAGYEFLDVRPAHTLAVEALPDLHSDPFDRLLVAQALTEPLRLVTADVKNAAYSDTVILI